MEGLASFGRELVAGRDLERERDRVSAHFAWVLAVLEVQTHEGWSQTKDSARRRTLDALADYAARGRFPRNLLRDRMAPSFVDDRGHECAVAYLMLETGDDDLVDAICRTDNLAYVRALDEAAIEDWLDRAGITFAEAAFIQPDYCPFPDEPCAVWASEQCSEPPYPPIGCDCYRVVRPDGDSCGAGDACSSSVCMSGFCVPQKRDCDDHDASTLDKCDLAVGCVHVKNLGSAPRTPGPDETGEETGAADVTLEGGCNASFGDWLTGSPAALLAATFLLTIARRRGRS